MINYQSDWSFISITASSRHFTCALQNRRRKLHENESKRKFSVNKNSSQASKSFQTRPSVSASSSFGHTALHDCCAWPCWDRTCINSAASDFMTSGRRASRRLWVQETDMIDPVCLIREKNRFWIANKCNSHIMQSWTTAGWSVERAAITAS